MRINHSKTAAKEGDKKHFIGHIPGKKEENWRRTKKKTKKK